MPRDERDGVERLEALGVRIFEVDGLDEGVLYFRKRAMVLVDAYLGSADRNDGYNWVGDQIRNRALLKDLKRELSGKRKKAAAESAQPA